MKNSNQNKVSSKGVKSNAQAVQKAKKKAQRDIGFTENVGSAFRDLKDVGWF